MNTSNIELTNSELPRFGERYPNKGWIECRSKTYPDLLYYYNINSKCTTWIRPVPEKVALLRYNPKKVFMHDDSSVDSSVDLSQFKMSSSEHSVDFDFAKDIISRLNKIPDPKPNNASSDNETSDSFEYDNFSDISELSILSNAKLPEILYFYPDEDSKAAKQLMKLQSTGYSSTDSYSAVDNYYFKSPCLKNIEITDLVVVKERKRRKVQQKPKLSSSVSSLEDSNVRIYEMEGTKTYNYNLDVKELKKDPKKKIRTLSDSSSSSRSSSCSSSRSSSSSSSSNSSSSSLSSSLSSSSDRNSCSYSCNSSCESSMTSSTSKNNSSKSKLKSFYRKLKQPVLSDSSSTIS